jgi:hypothetical protein
MHQLGCLFAVSLGGGVGVSNIPCKEIMDWIDRSTGVYIYRQGTLDDL